MAKVPNIVVKVVPCTCKWPGIKCPTHTPTLMARVGDAAVCAVAIAVGVALGAVFAMAVATVAPWWMGAAAATIGYLMWRKWAPR